MALLLETTRFIKFTLIFILNSFFVTTSKAPVTTSVAPVTRFLWSFGVNSEPLACFPEVEVAYAAGVLVEHLVDRPDAGKSVLLFLFLVASLLVVARPGAPSSFLFLEPAEPHAVAGNGFQV